MKSQKIPDKMAYRLDEVSRRKNIQKKGLNHHFPAEGAAGKRRNDSSRSQEKDRRRIRDKDIHSRAS